MAMMARRMQMMAPRAGHRMPKSQRKAWKMSWIEMFISFVFNLGLCVLDVVMA
jgi:hypothetical protein